ncbi:ABC transporter ATP-binding protein [Microbacterium sp. NPDC055910]|uniref:ABC transporter ATP-binding protein n=1 Tax=Microbacterium sp. NPDC055910 TaxID=3345659 RepID=UPI0035D6E01A
MRALNLLYRELLAAAPPGAARFARRYSVTLGFLSILDAAALGLLALIVGPIASGSTPTLPVIGRLEGASVFITLGIVCLLIVVKGGAASVLLWIATRRFARFEFEIGARLFGAYISAPWAERLKKNSSDLIRLTDSSLSLAVGGFLLPGSTVVGEAMSLVAILVVLAIASPGIAIVAIAFVAVLGAVLYVWIARNARVAGRVNLAATLRTSRLMTEMVGALKELTLRGKEPEMTAVVGDARSQATRARGNIHFLNQVPRYVLEAGVVVGIALVGVVGFTFGGPTGALSAVALFGLAGFRMTPAVIRLQAIASQMAANAPQARAILDEIHASEASVEAPSETRDDGIPTAPELLILDSVGFRYAPDAAPAVDDVSLQIPFGSTVAFVGSSGSGKSTTVDLILSLLSPTSGAIRIDETPLRDVSTSWKQHVGYVPQEVALFDTTVGQNVALTWKDDYDRDRAVDALRRAQVWDVFDARGGLDSPIGERGLSLSGGQRQRLGIARALYADPYVLVMDEATSALDTSTEAAVTSAIGALHGRTTVIVVAHRLATIQHADRIFFMREGRVTAQGTFAELVRDEPDFARQAMLAGLTQGEL